MDLFSFATWFQISLQFFEQRYIKYILRILFIFGRETSNKVLFGCNGFFTTFTKIASKTFSFRHESGKKYMPNTD